MTVAPSWKVTMPVGVPATEGIGETVAVNDADWGEGLTDQATAVVDALAWTFCTMVTEDAG